MGEKMCEDPGLLYWATSVKRLGLRILSETSPVSLFITIYSCGPGVYITIYNDWGWALETIPRLQLKLRGSNHDNI